MAPKILFLQHRYLNRAGTEQHSRLLAAKLRGSYTVSTLAIEPVQEGHHQIVLIKEEERSEGWAVPTLPFPETPWTDATYEKIFKDVLDSEAPDLVHVHHLLHWPLCILEEVRRRGIPMIYTLHDYYALSPEYTLQSGKVPDHTPYYQKRLAYFGDLLQSATCVAPSLYVAHRYRDTFQIHATVIPHGIDLIVRSALPDHQHESAFGYIGSFLPQKGFDLMLRAFQHYRDTGGGLKLHLFGGTLPFPIEGVECHGVYDTKDLGQIMNHIAVGIIPSRFPETFCLTLSELWAAGVYVIASDQGALSERLLHAGPAAGITYPSHDMLALSQRMHQVEVLQPWRSSQTTPVRTAQEMCDDYKKLYHDILNRSHRSA